MEDKQPNGSWVMTKLEERLLEREYEKLRESIQAGWKLIFDAFRPYGTMKGKFAGEFDHFIHSFRLSSEQYYAGYTTCLNPELVVSIPLVLKQAMLDYAVKVFLEDLNKAKESIALFEEKKEEEKV